MVGMGECGGRHAEKCLFMYGVILLHDLVINSVNGSGM